MSSNLVDIAGPYGAETAAERELNVLRAQTLWWWVLLERMPRGHIVPQMPICVHPFIHTGLLRDEVAEERQNGLDAVCQMAFWVGNSGGDFLGILRDDGSMSGGTVAEHRKWIDGRDCVSNGVDKGVAMLMTWGQWATWINDHEGKYLIDRKIEIETDGLAYG